MSIRRLLESASGRRKCFYSYTAALFLVSLMYLQVYDDLQKRSQEFVSTSELNNNNILQRGFSKSYSRISSLVTFSSPKWKDSAWKLASRYPSDDLMEYVAKLEMLKRPNLESPSDIHSDLINIGFLAVNTNTTTGFSSDFLENLARTLESLLTYSTTPLHFIILTDLHSVSECGQLFLKILSRRLSHDILRPRFFKWRGLKALQNINISFVNYEEIISGNREGVDTLKSLTWQIKDENADKYINDLFYVGPFYHTAFTNIDKLLLLDSSDLDFRCDVKEVYEHFNEMSAFALIGMSLDLSPFYLESLDDYINIHNGTELGSPGRFQGFNSGVVLFHLERMRGSSLYKDQLKPKKMVELVKSFDGFTISTGDQDWFNLVSFTHPGLFYTLPCVYNMQTSVQYLYHPMEDRFVKYHFCADKSQTKIFHYNGCGPRPDGCHNKIDVKDPDTVMGKETAIVADKFWIFMMIVYLQVTNKRKFHA